MLSNSQHNTSFRNLIVSAWVFMSTSRVDFRRLSSAIFLNSSTERAVKPAMLFRELERRTVFLVSEGLAVSSIVVMSISENSWAISYLKVIHVQDLFLLCIRYNNGIQPNFDNKMLCGPKIPIQRVIYVTMSPLSIENSNNSKPALIDLADG